MESAISVSNVSKTFVDGKQQVRALDGVSLQVKPNQFASLVGPSGCGKSTLLRILSGLIPYDTGEILLSGETPEEAKKNIRFGFVFQDPALLPWATTLENVLLPLKVLPKIRWKEHRKDALALLAMVGLDGYEGMYPTQLSGGMQQRVSVVRALIYDPPILLLDEPFGALDAFTRENLNLEVIRIWHNKAKTAILVTHNISEAVFMSDRVIIMASHPGRVVGVKEVDLERPRQLSIRQMPYFLDQATEVREVMGEL